MGEGPTDKEANVNCVQCHGRMKLSSAPFHFDRNGYHLTFDSVPAWVCDQCGEPYFQEREVNAMQRVIQGLDEEARQLVADF